MLYADKTYQIVVSLETSIYGSSSIILGGVSFEQSKFDGSLRSTQKYSRINAISLRDRLIKLGYHPLNIHVKYSHLS